MKRLLPIGIQDFTDIRERGFVYIDKTARIHDLISGSGKPFFLARPRRFGKSLLCSTFKAIFEGRRELFGEMAGQPALAINSLDWEWKKHPVIRLDLNAGVYSNGVESLHSILHYELNKEAQRYGITLEPENVISQFKYLIKTANEKAGEKTVVIIDEYDKPLLETMTDRDLHIAIRNELRGVYGVLKSSDEFLRFVFLTGVTEACIASPFSHVSVFSDLNQLVDLTLNPRYADICGLTEEEVLQDLEPEIAEVLNDTGRERETYLENLRRYYNGYRFSDKPFKVYNPFGLLNHFYNNGKFLPYWYETGTPSFLIKLISKQKIDIANLDKMKLKYEDFRKYDIENMDALPILHQSGYLTITSYDEDDNSFTLDYPNLEVRASFSKSLLEQVLNAPNDKSNTLIDKLPAAFRSGNIEEAIDALRQYLAAVPYDIIKETENYYETAVHLIFSMLGLNCRSEVRIASGRIDTIVETKDFVYCFEFKIDKTADEALAQIDSKDYLLPWAGSGKKLFKVGVNFDSEKHNIGDWKYNK